MGDDDGKPYQREIKESRCEHDDEEEEEEEEKDAKQWDGNERRKRAKNPTTERTDYKNDALRY